MGRKKVKENNLVLVLIQHFTTTNMQQHHAANADQHPKFQLGQALNLPHNKNKLCQQDIEDYFYVNPESTNTISCGLSSPLPVYIILFQTDLRARF